MHAPTIEALRPPRMAVASRKGAAIIAARKPTPWLRELASSSPGDQARFVARGRGAAASLVPVLWISCMWWGARALTATARLFKEFRSRRFRPLRRENFLPRSPSRPRWNRGLTLPPLMKRLLTLLLLTALAPLARAH